MLELKSCPFCGNKPELKHTAGSYGYYAGRWGVCCNHCGIHTKSFDDEYWVQGKGHISCYEEAKQQAIDVWNKREED